jgi:hypothetical protein
VTLNTITTLGGKSPTGAAADLTATAAATTGRAFQTLYGDIPSVFATNFTFINDTDASDVVIDNATIVEGST